MLSYYFFFFLLCLSTTECISQGQFPHRNAHSHNDYLQVHPLIDALRNGFISVEADAHLKKGRLLVAHQHASDQSPSLEELYFAPLDSIITINNGQVYPTINPHSGPFYLMIDVKTEANTTYYAIKTLLLKYPALRKPRGPVMILLSGNRAAIQIIQKDTAIGIGIDGRPDDVGKGFSAGLMPVVSDHYKNWSHWNGKSAPTNEDLADIKALAIRVHAEGKKLRLWAIPDNENVWGALLDAGVDFINTDHLEALNIFLKSRGL